MDPHQRLLLELGAASHAHDATPTDVTAVFVGLSNHDWLHAAHHLSGGAYFGTSTAPSIAANRLSYTHTTTALTPPRLSPHHGSHTLHSPSPRHAVRSSH
jgi:acyl transferase domain-containing protein